MPSIDITAPKASNAVNCPFDVQGPYDLKDTNETAANVQVVVNHPNGNKYPFGPQAPNNSAAYDITCNNVPSSNGKLASVTATLLAASNNGVLATSTTQVVIL
jgi:hypothetical protein